MGHNILKEGSYTKFRNERKRFLHFLETISHLFPDAMSKDQTLKEPYRTICFLVTVGQRPITSLLVLDIFMREGILNGKEVGYKLARELRIPTALTTKGGNYKDRVGDLISAFKKMGILEQVSTKTSRLSTEDGFRIRDPARGDVQNFLDCIRSEEGLLKNLQFSNLDDIFKTRFDQKLEYVVKSGSDKRQPFSIGKIMKSLLNLKLGISFETALRVIEEVEPRLKKGMRTVDIQSALYNTLKEFDSKAAENYRLSYPEILSITMIDGEVKTVNYGLVKTLIDKEVRLKLTSNLLDDLAKTVYNVITRNPKNYESETEIREYVEALVSSECVQVRSQANFVRDYLARAKSVLEGCQNSLQSDEIATATLLMRQFLEQISLVTLVEFGYLPFKDFTQNVDLISNLLKQSNVKEDLGEEYGLSEENLFYFHRIKYLMQRRDEASRKGLEKMVEEGERIIALCEVISQSFLQDEQETIKAKGRQVSSKRLLTTGFEDLDNMLFGGLPENHTVLLTAPSCDERDILIERFLEIGVEGGEKTFYVTIDARGAGNLAEDYQSNFYLFLCNPEADVIIQASPNIVKLRGVESLTEIDIALTSAFRELTKRRKRPRRACIEILSDVLLQHHAVSTRRWLTALLPKFRANGFTTLATMNPHMHSSQEVQAMLDLFQGEIHIYKRKTEKGLRHFLRIEKMHNQRYIERELALKKERMRKESY